MSRSRTAAGLAVDIRRASTPKGREGVGAYVIEGMRLVERALRSGAIIEAVICADDFCQPGDHRAEAIIADLESADSEIFRCPRVEMTSLTAGRKFGAIAGLVRLPNAADLASIVGDRGRRVRILCAVDVEDPGNVGALLRTALASGVDAVLTTGVSDPFHPRAVRTSMGSVFRIPMVHMDTESLVKSLQGLGFQTVATVVEGGTDIRRFRWPAQPIAVLMGSESHALPDEVVAEADHIVSMPMQGAIDSYSVNAAAAIILHETLRSVE